MIPPRFTHLGELLEHRATRQPDSLALGFLDDGILPGSSLTYAQLANQAAELSGRLQSSAGPGTRALLLLPAGLDFAVAFFACLQAGIIAVPVPAPHPARLTKAIGRLQAIAADAGATVIISDASLRLAGDVLCDQYPALRRAQWIDLNGSDEEQYKDYSPASFLKYDTALLQYTSGSTSDPRGVIVTHENLLSNLAAIEKRVTNHESSVSVSWLPHFHDMGLVGGILQPIYGGYPGWLMSPATFLHRPARWLEAITSLRATFSGGPDFAYDLCVRRISLEQRASLDLSSWEYAFNGSEPVRQKTMIEFSQTFEDSGFHHGAWRPVYGLAEATLMVAGGSAGSSYSSRQLAAEALEDHRVEECLDDERGVTSVSCGPPIESTKVLAVHPETHTVCPPGEVGELWVRGPGVARGYWGKTNSKTSVFEKKLLGAFNRSFLRTGDLGFVADGEIHVTGRMKDLIIIRGRKLYPQDIELTVETCHSMIRPHACAAFSIIDEGVESVAVAVEIERAAASDDSVFQKEVTNAIRQAVSETHEVGLAKLTLLRPGSLPRTTSGKIRRSALKTRLAPSKEIISVSGAL